MWKSGGGVSRNIFLYRFKNNMERSQERQIYFLHICIFLRKRESHKENCKPGQQKVHADNLAKKR